ncbi:hypothetical protein FQN50_000780 [Emmonsiellopsis sp. PD_5]|nr:hypothetical protein FQN50_000780 [Emmonsiellopsis sp. PD_5]
MRSYYEIDLNEDLCIFPPCMHFLTVSSMDGQMDFRKYYTVSEDGNVEGITRISDPFSVDEVKVCATCRGSLRKLSRYGRIVRRALIDEASKKFVQWSSQEYIRLAKNLDEAQKQLQGPEQATQSRKPANVQTPLPENLNLTGNSQSIFNTIRRLANTAQYKPIVKLTKEIDLYVQHVKASEQPYSKICDMVENARRRHGIRGAFQQDGTIIQMKGYILATSLQLRCDLVWLSHFFNTMRDSLLEGFTKGNIKVDLTQSIEDCNHLIDHASASKRPRQEVEGLLYKAHFMALQRPFASSSSSAEQSTEAARSALNLALSICTAHPSQTNGLPAEIAHVQSILRGSTFYMPVSTAERLEVLTAMAREFRGSGHWYYCRNNHPFTIGECGMPMQQARCPECGEGVGGREHRAVEGVRRAEDLEGLMGGLRV